MNRIRSLAIGIVLMSALTTVAQQPLNSTGGPAKVDLPTVQEQLKVLTEKLDLTGTQ
jgi:hypothetical protein